MEVIKKEFDEFARLSDDRLDLYFDVHSRKGLQEKHDKQYICHTAWAARVLKRINPGKHVDIASSLFFNTLISAFIPTQYYNYLTADLRLDNLQINFADLNNLPFDDNSIPSLSCMHVVEHIGLGRYGDIIDPAGDLKAMAELKRVSSRDLLFVVPIGTPIVVFNLHRIYAYKQIISYFQDMKLMEFALIPDQTPGNLIINAPPELADEQKYGCGCFWFRKD